MPDGTSDGTLAASWQRINGMITAPNGLSCIAGMAGAIL